MGRLKLLQGLAALIISAVALPVSGEEYRLPDAGEIQFYSAEAQQFYTAGVAALDRVDYTNAYNMLSKATQLQPQAVKLNTLTAGLAQMRGRAVDAEEARDYYETAITAYNNVLSQPTVDPETRRKITNQLKIASDERDNLAQRDVLREANGTTYLIEQSRLYGRGKQSPSSSSSSGSTSVTLTTSTQNALPYPGMVIPTNTPGPGQPGYVDPNLFPAPGFPGAPGLPGAPGAPLPLPGGAPPLPGAPGGTQGPGGEIPI